ncbi:nuclear transport factor 2 family protein [Rudaeicoccus suwonensis]|uniref:Ketosteroid isomerase-like protein n=1 Tax=Rudaeicoccus suwonensis TaxID=657409 RepID=A0A561E300_9MICO|nr:nuclear transport factor 2 family protein [Rudaeicoccus suwonensis]TWE09986.1 ketosteroid isomerase-like protein [Rudaeicoccus suwonensis]
MTEPVSVPHPVTVDTLEQLMVAFNAHDLDAIMEFFDEDCSFDTSQGPEPYGSRLVGKKAVREGLAARFTSIPDVQYAADRHWVSGSLGVSEWLVTGTTSAGDSIRARGCDLWEFRDGRIARKDSYWKSVGA